MVLNAFALGFLSVSYTFLAFFCFFLSFSGNTSWAIIIIICLDQSFSSHFEEKAFWNARVFGSILGGSSGVKERRKL